jgi:general secretion pathway protein A
MYNAYFHFSCSPFENTLDQRFLFMSESHEEVVAALLYFVEEKKSFALVCGDVGTGKTMIVHHLIEKLPRSVLPILIPYPDVEFIEMLRYIARVLEISSQEKGVLQLVDDVKEALSKMSLEGRQVVLIIDEAHLLPVNSLENIRLISNIELTQNKLVQIVLIGQIELGLKLRKEGMHQFRQRINVNRVLSPMSSSETVEYADHRLKIAGSSFDECFDQGCRKLLYEMTGGVPRSINLLCDTAFLVCMTENSHKVSRRILKNAYSALNTDLIQTPQHGRMGAFSYAFSHAKKFRTAFAAAALTLVVTLGVLALKGNPGERIMEWLYGAYRLQEESRDVAKDKLPASQAKSQETLPQRAREDSSSITLRGHEDQPVLNSKLESGRATPAEALTVKKTDENVPADNTVSPPGGETLADLPTPKRTEDRTIDKNLVLPQPPVSRPHEVTAEEHGTRDAAPDRPDQNPHMTQPAERGADRVVAGERETEDAAPQRPQAQKRSSESSDFFMVTVQKGENLNRIAARWFPEDPGSGKKLILAANPVIHDQNLILAGQILRVPKKRAGQ